MTTSATAQPLCSPRSTSWKARSSAVACSAIAIKEFIRFLNTIEADIPAGKIIHVVLDNYATHKHAKVRAWLDRHPRFVFHYTPTSASWLNAVEGFSAKLTKRRLKRGVFRSIVDLQAAINRFLKETNDDPKPFVWTADPDKIIAAVKRGNQALGFDH
jgi:transposase